LAAAVVGTSPPSFVIAGIEAYAALDGSPSLLSTVISGIEGYAAVDGVVSMIGPVLGESGIQMRSVLNGVIVPDRDEAIPLLAAAFIPTTGATLAATGTFV
jgi:hypothetical protein